MSEVGDAIRELAHVVKTEEDIEGIALQVDDLWNRVQAHREATPAIETDTTSEVARVRYVEAQPDSGPHRPAMPAHYRIEFADGTFWAIAANFLIRQGVPKPQEAQIATQEPAGATQGGSGDSRASGGLGERLRALVAEPDPEESQYESVDVAALVGLADEAHRLEVHARVVEQSLRTARLEGDGARIKGEQWKARYEETRDANRRVLGVAQWLRGQGLVGYARKVEEAVGGMEGALNADHPLGKVIGVIRECGTELYKTEDAP